MNARLMGRPARAAAALGALVAAGAVTLVATMGTANAAGAGRCIDNVNVREQPDISSQIVAVCERGQAVQVGETRDGFVELTDLKGWAAQEYVSVDGHVAAAPATPRTTSAKPKPQNGSSRSSSTAGSHNPAFADPFGDDEEEGTNTRGADSNGTAATGEDRTADGSAATTTPTAGADSSSGGDDASATDTDPAAAPTTQASPPASPMAALGHLLG
jgi:uncharacterized protein YraI